LQAHLKTAPANAKPKFLKELAKPAQEKKYEAFTNTLKINNKVSNFKIFLQRFKKKK